MIKASKKMNSTTTDLHKQRTYIISNKIKIGKQIVKVSEAITY